jgi:hypothetical protein
VLDTRVSAGAAKDKLGAGRTLALTGPGPSAGAAALNVTGANPTDASSSS